MGSFRTVLAWSVVAAPAALLGGCAGGPAGVSGTVTYPESLQGDAVDDYHGVAVADPYRWMEALDTPPVDRWVEAQNDVARPYLESLPMREGIRERLTELWNYERYGTPFKEGGYYFYTWNSGLMDQNHVYVTSELSDDEPTLLLDPNAFSEDGTVALAGMSVSPAGNYVAYAKSDGGSDWRDWFFRDIRTGEDLPDRLTHTKFTSMAWTRDGTGVFYSRYPLGPDGAADDSQQVAVYFHLIGTPQDEDQLVYDLSGAPTHRGLAPDPYASVTEDGRYVVVGISAGYHENKVSYIDLSTPEKNVVPLIDEWVALYSFVGNDGRTFFFSTTDDAPNSRVIAVDLDAPDRASWREVIPEADEALRGVSYVGGRLITQYLKDAKSLVKVYAPDGTLVDEVDLPGIGTAGGFGGHQDDPTTFFSFSGFTSPSATYSYDVSTSEVRLMRRAQIGGIDPDAYETRQVFYPSADGTMIPMFITHKKGLELNGDNPTLLYGYGGFNVSLTPRYSTSRMAWMEMGGVLAIPNLRGGGEYGKRWHVAGTKLEKQNVFDDFIAAAEWLIDNGYTRPQRLGIQGGSNGGLLVGACMVQRPDLFGAALPAVGVLDMLRYHTASANARNWSTDYGLSENPDEFRAQFAYSPVHNVFDGICYPPTLITTADHDDRVVPWHSYKFAAALQAAQDCDNAVLIRVETRAGHGAGKPTWMVIEGIADQWAFLAYHLGMNGAADDAG